MRVGWQVVFGFLFFVLLGLHGATTKASDELEDRFYDQIQPILETYCYGCHGYGAKKGGVALDAFEEDLGLLQTDHETWWAVLKNLRAGVMPPPGKERPSSEEVEVLVNWIKYDAFAIDPNEPDPGRVTVRRLNRVEYRNTIRDLTGVDYDTRSKFPPDDSGHGFDNIADVLSISPLLMEKYIAAAQEIVAEAMPDDSDGDNDNRLQRRNRERYFPSEVPGDEEARRTLAHETINQFATKAFRRPVAGETLERLVNLAERVYSYEGSTFENGISQAMIAILASPQFLFREEEFEEGSAGPFPLIDEYALASRLSYFLWSSMPDDELFQHAERGTLRENLNAEVTRMLNSSKSDEFVEGFVGQWLKVRDIESVPINAFAVLSRDQGPDPEFDRIRSRFRELRRRPQEELTEEEREELDEVRSAFFRSFRRFREFELDGELRRAMRRETEMLFDFIVRENRSVLELLDSDYTFLNGRLAKHYGIEGIEGGRHQRVALAPESLRGGVLTHGTVLAVTSNPDRTSPVKRGLFVLENLLGTPPPPPPPDIPALEESEANSGGGPLTLRETMALHRARPSCASCHDRMDPLGLALENFNALGRFRNVERGQPIDASGELVTGETFSGIRELKQILIEDKREDFYRCLTEKLLTYALGRGLEYSDVEVVDQLVGRLEVSDGEAMALLTGIVESPAFQRTRRSDSSSPEITASVRTTDSSE